MVGNVQPLLDVQLVALVLRGIGQRGVVETDDLVNSPAMFKFRVKSLQSARMKLLPGLFLTDLQFLAGRLSHLF